MIFIYSLEFEKCVKHKTVTEASNLRISLNQHLKTINIFTDFFIKFLLII